MDQAGAPIANALAGLRRLARSLAPCLLACAATAHAQAPLPEPALLAPHAVVMDEETGALILSKGAQTPVPMASLTKLLTAMVVLDAGQDLQEPLTIEEADLDTLKHTRGGVPPGVTLPRGKLLELALMASDNHAASSLARHYPGGLLRFLEAVRLKTLALELTQTQVFEPTGLSPLNRSSARDLADVVRAASGYPVIVAATTQPSGEAVFNGKVYRARNTNHLVGSPGWEILLSKTGFTNEAGRCLAMRLRAGGKTVVVVLLNERAGASRTLDATNVSRWLDGLAPLETQPTLTLASASAVRKASSGRLRARRGHRLA